MVNAAAVFYNEQIVTDFCANTDDAESQTEGEDLERARQMRMDEVKLKPLPDLPTDTETEVSLVFGRRAARFLCRLYDAFQTAALRR